MSEAKVYRNRNLQIVFAVTLVSVLGVSSITPAFPRMREALGVSDQAIGLLITAYTLPGVGLAPFLGVLADRLGRRRILIPSLFLFGVAGGACAYAGNFAVILVLRVLQGTGGAGLGSLSTTLIGDLFSGQRRTEAMGYNASVLELAVTCYPAIGGAMALLGYNYPFLLALLAVPVGFVVLAVLHNPEPRSEESLRSYLGGTWQYLKKLKVVGLFGAGVLSFFIMYGVYVYLFVILLGAEPYSASSLTIGIILSSMSLSTALVSSQLGRITRRFSPTSLIKAAFPLYGAALALIPVMPGLWYFLLPVALSGVAHGLAMPSVMTELAGLAPLKHRAAFMSINGMMLRLGQTIGPPLIALAYSYTSLKDAFFVAAVVALAATPIALAVTRAARRRG